MLTNGMAEAKAEMEASQDDGGMGSLGNVFGQPDVLQKIAANPQTAAFLADPGFVAKIQSLQRNPSAIGQHLQDQRVLQVMGMLMGVNIQTPDAPMPQASAPPPKAKAPEPEPEPLTPEQEAALALRKEAHFLEASQTLPGASHTLSVLSSRACSARRQATPPAVAQADEHKLKGNAAYKAKDFDAAIGHYEAAIKVRAPGPAEA